MNPEAVFGARGMIEFIAALRSPRESHASFRFPSSLEWRKVNLTCDEPNPRSFFVELIDKVASGGTWSDSAAIESCQIAEGLAAFVETSWAESRLLRCSVQIVANPDGGLEDLYLNEKLRGVYYRFDYSIEERGQIFDHPFPHVHSVPDGAPRFPFAIGHRVFPPFAILQFAMINHAYQNWIDWLLAEYAKHYHGEVPEDEPTPEEYCDAYKDESRWLRIEASKRNEFLNRLRRSSKMALERLSEGLPTVDPLLHALNY